MYVCVCVCDRQLTEVTGLSRIGLIDDRKKVKAEPSTFEFSNQTTLLHLYCIFFTVYLFCRFLLLLETR